VRLLDSLKEQSSFNFTGRLNILRPGNKQYLGVIYFLDGLVIDCEYLDHAATDAFLSIIIDSDHLEMTFIFLAEPEIVHKERTKITQGYIELFKVAAEQFGRRVEVKGLRPPSKMRLLLNASFIMSGNSVTPEEFSLMESMTEYNKVEDIYKNCPLNELELTEALVELRKKGAIKVLQS